jgi:NADH-quinone oxidoreductase subunit E
MFQLSKEGIEYVKKEMTRYESKQSAVIPALWRAQSENKGWISPEVIDSLAQIMDIPRAQIQEVATFYTMFNKKPIGRHHVQVCTNISCAMAGGRELVDHICKKLNVEMGEITSDGRFTVSHAECLGSCGTAPMAQIDDNYYESLNNDKIETILGKFK